MTMDANGRAHRAKGLPKGYAGAYDGTGAGHYGDGSTYPIGHTVITANGGSNRRGRDGLDST